MSNKIFGISVPTAVEQKKYLKPKPAPCPEPEPTYDERNELSRVLRSIDNNKSYGYVWINNFIIGHKLADKLRGEPFNYRVTAYPLSANGPQTLISWD